MHTFFVIIETRNAQIWGCCTISHQNNQIRYSFNARSTDARAQKLAIAIIERLTWLLGGLDARPHDGDDVAKSGEAHSERYRACYSQNSARIIVRGGISEKRVMLFIRISKIDIVPSVLLYNSHSCIEKKKLSGAKQQSNGRCAYGQKQRYSTRHQHMSHRSRNALADYVGGFGDAVQRHSMKRGNGDRYRKITPRISRLLW